jgi:hypothetical protein
MIKTRNLVAAEAKPPANQDQETRKFTLLFSIYLARPRAIKRCPAHPQPHYCVQGPSPSVQNA